MWIRKQDINGNWGYYNLETGEFRSTIPGSNEEKLKLQELHRQAVLKTHSARLAKVDTSRRNHSDETIKKKLSIPIVVTDADGNYSNKQYETLAPGEDSALLNTFWEELFPLVKGMLLAGGLTKLALSKTGSNSAARWARNSLLNEEFKPIYKGFVRGSNPIIGRHVSETFANNWLSNAPSSVSTPVSPLKRSINIVKNNEGKRIINKVETPVKFPEGKAVIEGNYNTPVWIDSSGKKYYIDSGIKREPYDLTSSNVFKITSPENKDILIGVLEAFFPEDLLIHYSKDLMPIKNGKFQPITPKSGDFKAIWWERNKPATLNRRTTFTKVKDNANTHIANNTKFGDNQTITTGEYPITSAESITPNPYTGFWDKVIYSDTNPEISKSLVTLTKYNIDPSNPQHLNSVIGAWKRRYPETASYIKIPTKEEIADTPYLITGEIPISDRGLAISKVMENRASRYTKGNEFFVTPGLPITRSVGSYFNNIRNKPTKLYIPFKNDGMGGFYYQGDAAVKMNPWQSKPYTLTQIHEGLSHASDGLVENLKTPIKGTPIVSGVTTPAPKTGGMYGRISYPEDIYGKDMLKNILHKDSEKGIEARAMNWEMISDLYAQLAKEKGITFKEATELPESEFGSFVSTKLKEPADLSKFMKKFNSQYLTDYANLMEKGTPELASEYAKRIRSGILTLPAMLPFMKTKE